MRTLVASEDLILSTCKLKNPSKFCRIPGQLSFKIVSSLATTHLSYRTLDVLLLSAGDGGLALISEIRWALLIVRGLSDLVQNYGTFRYIFCCSGQGAGGWLVSGQFSFKIDLESGYDPPVSQKTA